MPVSLSKEKNKRRSKGNVVQEKWESRGKKETAPHVLCQFLVSLPPLQVLCLRAGSAPTPTLE